MSRTLQFKISLLDTQPLIWRTFNVEESYRMDRFHQVLQIVMGWQNSHLHEFNIQGTTIGMLTDDDFDSQEMADETKYYLKDFSLKQGDTFEYLYDFGDDWRHLIQVLSIEDSPSLNPVCLAGACACPLEDCGGIPGYLQILDFKRLGTKYRDYQDWVQWVPKDYDPNDFPIKEVNMELDKFGAWHKKHPKVKSTPWHRV